MRIQKQRGLLRAFTAVERKLVLCGGGLMKVANLVVCLLALVVAGLAPPRQDRSERVDRAMLKAQKLDTKAVEAKNRLVRNWTAANRKKFSDSLDRIIDEMPNRQAFVGPNEILSAARILWVATIKGYATSGKLAMLTAKNLSDLMNNASLTNAAQNVNIADLGYRVSVLEQSVR